MSDQMNSHLSASTAFDAFKAMREGQEASAKKLAPLRKVLATSAEPSDERKRVVLIGGTILH